MTMADCVHSTPPTNTSANNQPDPVDMARRRFLSVAAAGAVGAAIPAADARVNPGHTADPIYAVIEAHRKADAVADVAFAESSRLYQLACEMVGPSKIEVPNMLEPGTTAEVRCSYDVE